MLCGQITLRCTAGLRERTVNPCKIVVECDMSDLCEVRTNISSRVAGAPLRVEGGRLNGKKKL